MTSIQSVTIQGFKSFLDTQIIQFTKGSNVVLGRNGIGKSNILDAILLGLSLPISKLRCNSASDLLHKVGMKSENTLMVEIEFSDCSKIKVMMQKQKLQREFFVNGKRSSIKGVKEFLASKGVFLHSTNPAFLIQQNSITQIPTLSPSQLAELIKDANGSLVFELKVNQAQQKLVEWQSFEADMQEKMKEVENKFEELEKIQLQQEHSKNLKRECARINKAILIANVKSTMNQIFNIELEIQTSKNALKTTENEIKHFIVKKEELMSTVHNLKTEVEELSTCILEKKLNELKISRSELEEKHHLLEIEEKNLKVELESEIMKKNTRLKDVKQSNDNDEQIQKVIITKSEEIEALKKKINLISQDIENEVTKIYREIESHISIGTDISDTISKLEKELVQINVKILKLEKSIPRSPYASLSNIVGVDGIAIERVTWGSNAKKYLKSIWVGCEGNGKNIILKDSSKFRSIVKELQKLKLSCKIWCLDRIRIKELKKYNQNLREDCAKTGIPVVFPLDLIEEDPVWFPVCLRLLASFVICNNDMESRIVSSQIRNGIVISNDTWNIHRSSGISISSGGINCQELTPIDIEFERRTLLQEIKSLQEKNITLSEGIRSLCQLEEKIRENEMRSGQLSMKECELESILQKYEERTEACRNDEFRMVLKDAKRIDSKVEYINIQLSRLSSELKNISTLLKNLDLSIKKTEESIFQQEIEISERKKDILKSKQNIEKITLELDELEKKRKNLRKRIQELNIESEQLKSKMGDEDDIEEYEEFSNISVEELERKLRIFHLEQNEIENELNKYNNSSNFSMYQDSWRKLRVKFENLQREKTELKEYISKSMEQVRLSTLNSFQAISRLFSKYIMQLLPGKTGYLKLINESDVSYGVQFQIFEGNEEITILQLSGGQKSLLSICFVFAMGGYDGTPFFLLDEIDAALDENNQMKLAQFLNQFSASGQQLIFISHHANFQQIAQQQISLEFDEIKKCSRVKCELSSR